MLYIIIAVIIVIVVMILFMVVVLNKLMTKVSGKIRNNVFDELYVYDNLIESKMAQIKKANQELERIKSEIENQSNNHAPSYNYGISNRTSLPLVNYIDESFLDNFKYIREKFSFCKEEILRDISFESIESSEEETQKAIVNLIKALNIETLFQLSTLNCDQQLEILCDSVTVTERELIKSYMEQKKEFDVTQFYSWLNNIYYEYDNTILVKTSNAHEDFSIENRNIMSQVDSTICEGIQIIYQNKLYDYSIQKMEIC